MSDSQSNAMEYPATIHVRSKLRLFQLFKDRLNEDRRTLFKTTCFGPWLDIIYVENDDGMIHYVLQKQCCSDDDNFDLPLIYHVNGHSLHFGRREFCLLTGFEFGSISFREYRNGDIPFRNRLFPEKIGYDVKIIDLFALFDDEEKFSKLSDEDAIRLCLLLSLEVIFIGRELVSVVDDVYLRMVNDLDAWNSFPWGEHIWRQLYDSIRNVSSKHKLEHLAGLKRNPNLHPSYSLTGFLFAFKTWIIESSCVSDRWWTKVPEIIPRALSWRRKDDGNVYCCDDNGDVPLFFMPSKPVSQQTEQDLSSYLSMLNRLCNLSQTREEKGDCEVAEHKIQSEIQRLYNHREARLNKIAKEDKQRKCLGHMNSSAYLKLAIEHCVPKKRKYVDVLRSPFCALPKISNVPNIEQLANQKNVLNPLMIEKCKSVKP
ncbi:phospholipase-like, aminotransferase-like mobile domain protein [Tanacetum coccineum]